MPGIAWVSCICPFDCNDPTSGRYLCPPYSAGRAYLPPKPTLFFHILLPLDVWKMSPLALQMRELSHQQTHMKWQKKTQDPLSRAIWPEGQITSKQITSVLLKNYSSSRMWRSSCHQLSQKFKNCPCNLVSLLNGKKQQHRAVFKTASLWTTKSKTGLQRRLGRHL